MSIDCYLTSSCKKFKSHPECVEADFCQKYATIDKLLSLANIPKPKRVHHHLFIDKTPDDQGRTDTEAFTKLKTQVLDRVKDFVDSGENLFIHSNICGNGKTSWALNIVQEYIKTIWTTSRIDCRALFVSVPTFLLAVKKNISQPDEYASYIKENILKADLVVWDDIATKSMTDYEAEVLFSILDQRLNEGKSNIYTCNLTEQDILDRMGDRLYSRVVKPSIKVEFYGKDKRGGKI